MRAADERRLAVGFFDGVHLGHQAILKGADAALTFRSHPLEVLSPERAPVLLMTVEERVAAMRACGVDEVTVLDFTPELARMTAEAFVGKLAEAALNGQDARSPSNGRTGAVNGQDARSPRGDRSGAVNGQDARSPVNTLLEGVVVRCGDNWRFGAGGRGDANFLRTCGIGVEVVPYAVYAGEAISSSRIRRALAEGEVAAAAAMLGRRYEVSGAVVVGKGLGGRLGFPTLNVRPGRPLPLKTGVYAVEVGGAKGVANFGLAPTLGERAWPEPVLEVHLLDAIEGCRQPSVAVAFTDFIRAERRFDSLEALRRQIAADCDFVRSRPVGDEPAT